MGSQDISKLPKWVQSRIEAAERSAEYWREKIQAGERGDTEVWVQYYPRDDVGLPPGSRISFKLFDDDGEESGRYDVSMTDEGTLEVRGVGRLMMDQLATIHRSSNVFEVRLRSYEEAGLK